MARSRKKTPIIGITTARSEKEDKMRAHRRERRRVRSMLQAAPDGEVLPHRREMGDVWTFAKDGKVYAGTSLRPEELRK